MKLTRDEAHKKGREDARYHRDASYEYDRYSSNPEDEAYYRGFEEERREEEEGQRVLGWHRRHGHFVLLSVPADSYRAEDWVE